MQSRGILEGIRVIDVTQWGAGPMCAGLLAQWGAEVIKVEHPIRGDSMRGLQSGVGVMPFKQRTFNYMFEQPNMNKKSMTLDLVSDDGQAILHRLVTKSDVFLAAMRPRDVKKFDIEYENLKVFNPKLIYALITGYGTKGTEKELPGYDGVCYFAKSGITYMTADSNDVPVWPRGGFGDIPSGMFCACGIVLALYARKELGIGQAVYTNLFNNGVWALAADSMAALATHQNPPRHNRETADNPLANFYKTKDNRWILLYNMQSELYWERFCKALGLESIINDPRFSSMESRKKNNTTLIKMVDDVFSRLTLKEWNARLADSDLVYSPVQTPVEAVEDPQARDNNVYESFNHPIWGQIELLPAPQKFTETPGTYRTPAPEWGQHTEEILEELDYTWDDIKSFKNKHVIA
jgi:crotonobetainyl-CoA:carnitine CoA-transferase CaiB-like acyl-CoA transferase